MNNINADAQTLYDLIAEHSVNLSPDESSKLLEKIKSALAFFSSQGVDYTNMNPSTQEILKDTITEIINSLKVAAGWAKPTDEIAAAVARALQ